MEKILFKGCQRRSLALSVAAISAALSMSPGSFAQEQSLEEITVTGSRIRQTDGMAMPVPVTAITPDELFSFEPGGTVAEQLDALPQFFGTQSAQRGGGTLFGSGGGSYLNMRSLGANRTLVLFDGSRVVPADKRGSVNVDTLPTALVRTVDVVTGGASAAYGADALGGVTNFVLDREFEGFKLNAGTGVTEFGDGERWNFSVAGGRQIGDRMNVIGSLQAMHINQITRNPEELDADWWQRWGYVTNPEWLANGSGPQRLSLPWVASSEHTPTGMIWARDGSNSFAPLIDFDLNGMTFLEDGSDVRPFVKGDYYVAPNVRGGTKSMSGGPEGQIANRSHGGGPSGQETVGRSAFAAVQYQFSDSLTAFAQILAGRSESNSVSERGGYELQDGWYATVFRDNAFLPANVAAEMDEAGIDSFQLHKNGSFLGNNDIGKGSHNKGVFGTYSWSVGLDAALPNGWDLRASWQSGESHKRTGVYDEIRVDRVFLGMDAVRDPATGAIVCNVQVYNPTPQQLAASVAGRLASPGGSPGGSSTNPTTDPLAAPVGTDNSIRDCVPYNVMGAGNMSQAAMDYTMTPKMGDSYIDQDFGEVLLQGEAYEGWGYGPVSFAAGLTWREQSFTDRALPVEIDRLGPPLNAPDLGIRGIPPGYTGGSANLHQFSTVPHIDGGYDVWEWFGELHVPIWESASASQRLAGDIAVRSSDYSNIGRVEAWKMGLDFQLFEDLRFRTTKSRDVREATFAERFDAQGGGGNVDDPRFGNGSFQITTVSGGNPNLKPEIADTVVAGLVYQPGWLEGLQLSSDWYEVEIRDAVSTLGTQRIVDDCESGVATSLCSQIERDPATGFIGRVHNVFLNVAQARVEGVDVEAVYRMEPDFVDSQFESFTFRALGGYIIERSNTPLGGQPTDSSGSSGTPKYTANLTGNYNIGPYGFQLQARHVDSTLRSTNWEEGVDVDDNTHPSATWYNARLAYNGETGGGASWNVALNVQNLFDKNPPTMPNFGTRGGGQSVSSNYDTFGRRYQLSVNYNF